MKKYKRKHNVILYILIVCLLAFLALGGRKTMLDNISLRAEREIIFTNTDLDMSAEEIVNIEGKPDDRNNNYMLYYNNRDYLGNKGRGKIIFSPTVKTATWEISGNKEDLNNMFDIIRITISEKYKEEFYKVITVDSRVCKWYAQNEDMKILLDICNEDTEWVLTLVYFKIIE